MECFEWGLVETLRSIDLKDIDDCCLVHSDLEFVKSFTPVRFQKIKFVGEDWKSGLGGLVNLVTYPQILSHIIKYFHILSNICGGGLEKWTCQSCQ